MAVVIILIIILFCAGLLVSFLQIREYGPFLTKKKLIEDGYLDENIAVSGHVIAAVKPGKEFRVQDVKGEKWTCAAGGLEKIEINEEMGILGATAYHFHIINIYYKSGNFMKLHFGDKASFDRALRLCQLV